jgi:5-methylcytosine-specific restriction protein A
MPLAPTPCRIPECRQLAKTGGACLDHTPRWAGSTRGQRLPKDWNTRRLIVLRRDDSVCYVCGSLASEVDHVVAGDNHDLNNLAAICNKCHRAKSSVEGHEAKQEQRPNTRRGYRSY